MTKHGIPILFAALPSLAGCGATPKVSLWNLCARPPDWTEIDGRSPELVARDCHLEIREDCSFLDPTDFQGDLDAGVDVALVGGEPRGFAGLFVKDLSASERPFLGVCVRETGEARVFRSSDPREPVGGRGWEPFPGRTPAGFFHLAVSVTGGQVRFFIDGRPVGEFPLDGTDRRAPRGFSVGIFNRGTASRWKNFAAGESRPSREFRPEEHAFWGEPEDARSLLERASEEAKRFSARPSRSGVYPVVASLDQALRILRDVGEDTAVRKAEEHASRVLGKMLEAAERIGETEFARAAFARLLGSPGEVAGSRGGLRYLQRAEEARRRGELAEAFCLYKAAECEGAGPQAAAAAKALEDAVRPLRLEVVVSGDVREPLFDMKVETWRVLRNLYGAAQEGDGDALRVEITTLKSSKEIDTTDGHRTVSLYTRGGEALSKLREEEERLSRSLGESLAEAQARMSILKASRRAGGLSRGGETQQAVLGGKAYELLVGDARKLEADERRLLELRKKIAEQEKKESVRSEKIAAKVQTISISYEFSLSVYLGSKRLVELPRQRAYRGKEQYQHPADATRGIPAARFRPELPAESLEEVRRSALDIVRTAVSPETVFSALPRSEQLAFAVRLARAARTDEALRLLEWALEELLGLKGSLRERVARACAEAG